MHIIQLKISFSSVFNVNYFISYFTFRLNLKPSTVEFRESHSYFYNIIKRLNIFLQNQIEREYELVQSIFDIADRS